MAKQVDPVIRELLFPSLGANVATDVFQCHGYDGLLVQIADAAAGTWSLQIQTNLSGISPASGDPGWKAIFYPFGSNVPDVTGRMLLVLPVAGLFIPNVRAVLLTYVSGTPRVFVASRTSHR